MNDAIVRVHRHEVPDPVAAHLQPLDEFVAPVLMFDEEQREVCREAFAKPDVIPVVFGDGIPEPLMRHLVDDHVPPAHVPFARDRGVAVEDGGRRLHSAPDAVRLHVRQLLVRVGADHVLVELHRLLRRHREIVESGFAILGVDPRLDRDAPEVVHGLDREPGDPERVKPRGDRDRLLPVRAARAVEEVGLFDEQSVGDDLVVGRRRDDEFARRLVVRVIDRRQPVPRLVGPVVAEEGAVAVLVGPDDQAGGRNPFVCDRDPAPLAGLHRGREQNEERVVPVLELQRPVGPRHGPDPHAGPVGLLFDQIQPHLLDPCLQEAEVDHRLARDQVRLVGEREREGVVERVDGRVLRIRVHRPLRWPLTGRIRPGSARFRSRARSVVRRTQRER